MHHGDALSEPLHPHPAPAHSRLLKCPSRTLPHLPCLYITPTSGHSCLEPPNKHKHAQAIGTQLRT